MFGRVARPATLRIAATSLVLVAVLLGSAAAMLLLGPFIVDALDFRAFYCAGKAVAAHANPYLAEPLRGCEQALLRSSGAEPLPFLTLPAPLPGYVLGPFALVAKLPFTIASAAFDWLVLVALASSALLLRALTGVNVTGILAALVVSGGWLSLENGQLAPLVLLLFCGSAFALAHGRPVAAALCASGAMLEPHVALPACVCLALTLPNTRRTFVLCAVALAALSLLALGWRANVAYLFDVLPEHALAESGAIGQFSATALLVHFGVPARAAVVAGNLTYALGALLGCVAARRLYTKTHASEFLVVLPAAFALFAGSFIHLSQMVIAVPALLLLWRHAPGQRTALGISVTLIAVPWQDLMENSPLLACLTVAAVSLIVASALFERRGAVAALALSATSLAIVEAAVRIAFPRPHTAAVAALAAAGSGGASADATWSVYERIAESSATPWYLVSHIPTWAGLLILIAAAVQVAFNSSALRLPAASMRRA